MELCRDSYVRAPLDAVYRAYRDELTAVAANVANIDHIESTARRPVPEGVACTHVWHGQGFIPRVARPFVKPEMLMLDDWVTWHDREHRCQWRVAPRYFNDVGTCSGELLFRAVDPHRTQVQMRGTMDVTLASLPFPKPVRGALARQVERFFVGIVAPNLRGVAALFEQHLPVANTASTAPA